MGALRIFRRSQEKKGKAVRKKYNNLKDKELRDMPLYLMKKANMTLNYYWNITEWKEA